MSFRLRIDESDLLRLGTEPYRLERTHEDAVVLSHVDDADVTRRVTYQEFHELLRQPDTRYLPRYLATPNSDDIESELDILRGADNDLLSYVYFAEAVCLAAFDLERQGHVRRTDASINAIMHQIELQARRLSGEKFAASGATKAGAKIVCRKMPCSKTIRRWLSLYEKGGYSAVALIPKTRHSGNYGLRWCHTTEAWAGQVVEIYASTQRLTKVQAIAETRWRIKSENQKRIAAGLHDLTVPSASSLDRRLKKVSPYYLHAKRYGTDAANKKFRLFQTGLEVLMPLERVEMDEKRLDVISLFSENGILDHIPPERIKDFRGRRWIYLVKCDATKCIVSCRIATTPNADDAVRALRDVFHDKTHFAKAAGCESPWDQFGNIGAIVTDHGSAFTSAEFRAAAESLGITIQFPPAGQPHLRGGIESMFRTVDHKLMPLLSGRTFFNHVERGDYPSELLACLSEDDLITVLLTLIIDIYHNQPHESLMGETPAACWARLTQKYGTMPPPDGLTLRKTFGRPLSRKLRGDGVIFAGLSYSCDALREAFKHSPQRTVEVRADLYDLGWIAVRVGDAWHSAICNHRGFDKVSYADWSEACRELRTKHRKAAALAEHVVHRGLERITARNRAAMARKELTSFHVTDDDVERNEKTLHYSIAPSGSPQLTFSPSDDLPFPGIDIRSADSPDLNWDTPDESDPPPAKRTQWRFDDE